MRKLRIMPDDTVFPKDPFGMNDLQDRIKAFCKEQGLDAPKFWVIQPDGYYMKYAVSLHLNGYDRWEAFDAHVVYLLRDFSDRNNREVEKKLLINMFEELGEPTVLTTVANSNQHVFFKTIDLLKMPVTWSDYNQNYYDVFTKGNIEMGGFVNLMERIEYIGKEYVYTK